MFHTVNNVISRKKFREINRSLESVWKLWKKNFVKTFLWKFTFCDFTTNKPFNSHPLKRENNFPWKISWNQRFFTEKISFFVFTKNFQKTSKYVKSAIKSRVCWDLAELFTFFEVFRKSFVKTKNEIFSAKKRWFHDIFSPLLQKSHCFASFFSLFPPSFVKTWFHGKTFVFRFHEKFSKDFKKREKPGQFQTPNSRFGRAKSANRNLKRT